MAPPLSDEEVHQEMKKMVAFIRQEAIEKAREIQVKADEEFNIEKAKLVRQEALHIEANYAKKLKQATIQRKMQVAWLFSHMMQQHECAHLISSPVLSSLVLSCYDNYSAQSTHINKSRLKVLQSREEKLEELFDEARKNLVKLSANTESYKTLLYKLALQVRPLLGGAHVTRKMIWYVWRSAFLSSWKRM